MKIGNRIVVLSFYAPWRRKIRAMAISPAGTKQFVKLLVISIILYGISSALQQENPEKVGG
jgi:hypothetical protein